MQELRNLIGGELVGPIDGQYLDNYEPATGQVYSRVPDSEKADVDRAVDAASQASPAWVALTAQARSDYLRALATEIEKRAEDLARAETIDNGKPLAAARSLDIPRSSRNLNFYADASTQFASESVGGPGMVNYTLRQPVGVAGIISPWNLPLYLLTWKIGPALASGCTVVAKPSEVTPMTAYLLSELAQKILPPGVLNIVHGTGPRAGQALVEHPNVGAVSFTGSTRTGADIVKRASARFAKVSLEMGGKNPTIIFADADLDASALGAARAAFSNQGEICLCGSRIFIERSVYDRVKNGLIKRAKSLKVGDPLESVDQGALVSQAHFERVMNYLKLAREEGGKILCGGEAVRPPGRCQGGWFVAPTLIEGLPSECRTNQEEIFGPVATLIPFEDENEVLSQANSVTYGLSASVWTQNISRGHRMAAALKNGVVWINTWMERDLRTPFGGMKSSGVGREGGWEAMRFFTEPKNVHLKVDDDRI